MDGLLSSLTGFFNFAPDAILSRLTFAEGDAGAGGGGGASAADGAAGSSTGEVQDAGAGGGSASSEEAIIEGAAGEGPEGQPAAEGAQEGAEVAGPEGEQAPGAEGEGEAAAEGEGAEGEAAQPAKPPTEMDKALNEAYRTHPELKEFLKAHPNLKPQWFFASQVQKEGLRTLEDVKSAKEAMESLYTLDNLFYSSTPDAPAKLADTLWKQSLKDPDQPWHPQYNPSSGAYERLAKHMVSSTMAQIGTPEALKHFAAQVGLTPDQFKIAVDTVARALGLAGGGTGAGVPTAPADAAASNPDLVRLEQERRSFEQERQTFREEQDRQFQANVESSFTNYLVREVDKALKPAAAVLSKQPKGVQSYVRAQIVERVAKAIEDDSTFNATFDVELRRGNRGPEHMERLGSMLEQRAQLYFADIAREVLGEIGYRAVAQQQARTSRQEAAASRREPVRTSSPARLTGGPARTAFKPTGNYEKDAETILGMG